MKNIQYTYITTQLGVLEIAANRRGVMNIRFTEAKKVSDPASGLSLKIKKQIQQYFRGQRKDFTFKTDLSGTPFQKKVWAQLQQIRYGDVTSYDEIARKIGRPRAWRAVGRAIGANPVGLAVPCHRVISKEGRLGGYAWGRARKAWLIAHEEGRGCK